MADIESITSARSLIDLNYKTREDLARETLAFLRFKRDPREEPVDLPDSLVEIRQRGRLEEDDMWDYLSREAQWVAGERLRTKFERITQGLRVLRLARQPHPDDDKVIAALGKAASATDAALARKRGRAFPISAASVTRMAEKHARSGSPAVIQTVAFSLLCFGTVSRTAEVLALKKQDVLWGKRHAVLRLRSTKTRQNVLKMVPRTGEIDCPTEWLRRHTRNLPPQSDSMWAEHTNVYGLLASNTQALTGEPVRRAHLIEDIRELLGVYVTGHSFRRGAVVNLVRSGVPLTVIQALGTWASAETVLTYCEEAIRLAPEMVALTMRPLSSQTG